MTAPRPSLRTLLIANRGEIARRIIRTAREMGIRTVAVYSEPDRLAPHVQEADVGVPIGGYRAEDSYLNHSAILDAAAWQGADAIHPGYGFLAESAAFAKQVHEAGLTWIGPSATAIRVMSDRIEAKAVAETAGVPVLASWELSGDDVDGWLDQVAGVGFPLIVKTVHGGGADGLRLVRAPHELAAAVTGAQHEAMASFGSGMVFAERWLAPARHIEVQVLADGLGNVIHLGELECSIQRRRQKIIAESPSLALTPMLRARLGDAAVAVTRALDYVGAATVEFLLPTDSPDSPGGDNGSSDTDEPGAFFFLEMHTHLQAEHPVTEAVTGLDLVRLQLEVASGLPLAQRQDAIAFSGHAVEVRLYAEDPAHGWAPGGGVLLRWRHGTTPGIRYDDGVETGASIVDYYEPLLSKIVAHARTRQEAVARLGRALRELHIHGPTTSRDYLVDVLSEPDFLAGHTSTDYIETHPPVPSADDPARYEREWQRFNAIIGPHLAAAALTGPDRHAIRSDRWPFALTGWRNVGGSAQEIRPGEKTWRIIPTHTGFATQTISFLRLGQRWDVTYGRVARDHPLAARRRAEGSSGAPSDLFNVTIGGPAGHTTTLVELIRLDDDVTLVHFGRRGHRCSVHTVDGTCYVNSALGQSVFAELPRFAAPDMPDAAAGAGAAADAR